MSAKVVTLVLLSLVAASLATPLDDYVKLADPTYKWEYVNSIRGSSFTVYNINVTSQTWLHPDQVSISVWTHWLQVCVPDTLPRGDLIGLMYIDSGNNKAGGGLGSAPSSADSFTAPICAQSNTVVANLGQVPNQPIIFASDPLTTRTEDSLIAYTWKQFMVNTTNTQIVATLPMTKAVVRGMDTVTAFLKTKNIKVPKFVVSGASKRGWTAWTTAAVDKRIVGIAPIVMPIANMSPLIDEMYRVYGTWSFALNDYVNAGVLEYLRTPQWNALLGIIDPKTYFNRWRGIPKYVIAAAGDEFFLPSSPRWWWDDLPEPKMLRMTPNTDHSFIEYTPGVASGLVAFMQRLNRDLSLPKFDWKLTYSNNTATIRAWATGFYQPQSVYLYHSTTLNPFQRDYRLLTCATTVACINPVAWTQERLNSFPGQTVWSVSMPAPAAGWTAFLLEAVYPSGYVDRVPAHANPDPWLRITTEANIVPDRLPFGYCEDLGTCQP